MLLLYLLWLKRIVESFSHFRVCTSCALYSFVVQFSMTNLLASPSLPARRDSIIISRRQPFVNPFFEFLQKSFCPGPAARAPLPRKAFVLYHTPRGVVKGVWKNFVTVSTHSILLYIIIYDIRCDICAKSNKNGMHLVHAVRSGVSNRVRTDGLQGHNLTF